MTKLEGSRASIALLFGPPIFLALVALVGLGYAFGGGALSITIMLIAIPIGVWRWLNVAADAAAGALTVRNFVATHVVDASTVREVEWAPVYPCGIRIDGQCSTLRLSDGRSVRVLASFRLQKAAAVHEQATLRQMVRASLSGRR